jgi:hypothetical protein
MGNNMRSFIKKLLVLEFDKIIKAETNQESKPATVDSKLTKYMNILTKFIKGDELDTYLQTVKDVNGGGFGDYVLKYRNGNANQFIIDIYDNKIQPNKNIKVGEFVAFIHKDKITGENSLQIQKVEIYDDYKGKGIMRNFYQSFNDYLKNNFENFKDFTSDFLFQINPKTGKYDALGMWEDLVNKGLAVRISNDPNDYVPPQVKPKNGLWKLKYGYKLK